MAFSTQKGFQHVPFLNEYPQPVCEPIEGIKLKTYAGTRDERAWSMSDKKKAQYLIDLVSCRMYDDDDDGLQEHSSNRLDSRKKQSIDQIYPIEKNNVGKEMFDTNKAEKDDLRFRLDESHESLKILKEENKALTAVLSEDHQPELLDDIKRKISQLRKLSKIDKNDENELLKMLDGLGKANKAFRTLNVKNTHLRKKGDQLPLRSDPSNIPIEPETSTDVKYLQNKVNSLRNQVAQLKNCEGRSIQKETISTENQSPDKGSENFDSIKAERDALREKCESLASVEGKIMKWKNEAEQFESFRKKACLALRQKDEQIHDYRERIEEVEYEYKATIKCFKAKEQERETICSAYDCLKEENQLLKEEICRCNCDLKGITKLQNQIQFLSKELCEKNCAIEQYDIQFQQLLGVIERLQAKTNVDTRSLQDVYSQTSSENIEELAASTRATLDQISKELEHQQELEANLAQSMADLETIRRESEEKERIIIAKLTAKEIENQKLSESLQKTSIAVKESLGQLNLKVNPDEDCSIEVLRLNEYITKIKSEHENEKKLLMNKSTDLLRDLENAKTKGSDVEKLSDQANNLRIELASAQDENRYLKNQNQELDKALEECKEKVKAQKDEITKLDKRTTELLCSSEANIKEVGKLVNDINNVQDRNANLKSVLGAVDYSEKSKQEIEDLKKLLEEEVKKSENFEKCKKEVEDLKKLLDEEMKKSKNIAEQNDVLQRNLDQAMKTISSQKANSVINENNQALQGNIDDLKKLLDEEKKKIKNFAEQNKNLQRHLDQAKENNEVLQRNLDQSKDSVNLQKKVLQRNSVQTPRLQKSSAKGTKDKTSRTVGKASDEPETDSKRKSVSRASDALSQPGSSREKKGSTKLTQLQKLHEATRNAERNFYEKEIEGHRMSNELLKNSLTKLTSKVQSSSAVDFEKEMRTVLDNFASEICKWRCEKNFKRLTKLQEICKRILEYGINSLSYKDLVYLHQRMSEAALRLKPNCLSSSSGSSQKELVCCKCSGKICEVPIIPIENKMLLEKFKILEREIESAREDLRKSKEQKEICQTDLDQSDPDTLRAIPKQISLETRKNASRPKSSRFTYKIKEEEFQIPTKDRCG